MHTEQGLLGKAEVVLKAHLTLQSHWMIYSVNGFNPGTHTCTDIHSGRVKQLDGFFRSTMQTEKNKTTHGLYDTDVLSHATHKRINSQ